jgi:hypothetical protein
MRLLNMQLRIPISIENNNVIISKDEFIRGYSNKGNVINQLMSAVADFVDLSIIGDNLIFKSTAKQVRELLMNLKLII